MPIHTSVGIGIVPCSSGMYGSLYKKFLWNFAVGTQTMWVTQLSCSSPFSTGIASVRKFTFGLTLWGQRQRTVKSLLILCGVHHFLSFKNSCSTSGILGNSELFTIESTSPEFIFQRSKLVKIIYIHNWNSHIYQELDRWFYAILVQWLGMYHPCETRNIL